MLVAVVTDIGLASVLIVEEVGAVVARTRKTGTSKNNNQKFFNLIFHFKTILGLTDVIRYIIGPCVDDGLCNC
jgi:hypothetical protein